MHHYNGTQHCSTETVLLIVPFLETNITSHMLPRTGKGFHFWPNIYAQNKELNIETLDFFKTEYTDTVPQWRNVAQDESDSEQTSSDSSCVRRMPNSSTFSSSFYNTHSHRSIYTHICHVSKHNNNVQIKPCNKSYYDDSISVTVPMQKFSMMTYGHTYPPFGHVAPDKL